MYIYVKKVGTPFFGCLFMCSELLYLFPVARFLKKHKKFKAKDK